MNLLYTWSSFSSATYHEVSTLEKVHLGLNLHLYLCVCVYVRACVHACVCVCVCVCETKSSTFHFRSCIKVLSQPQKSLGFQPKSSECIADIPRRGHGYTAQIVAFRHERSELRPPRAEISQPRSLDPDSRLNHTRVDAAILTRSGLTVTL